MKTLTVPNVHVALPHALALLDRQGIKRDSRNGPVLVAPWPVATVYEQPCQRVLFWQARDANPYFHLYESLWMLAGRNDVAGPARYAKQMLAYSDNGKILRGAYGHRWRNNWDPDDQLAIIARRLQENPDDRRCVLQMWDPAFDLDVASKDIPCNLTATFQRGIEGELNLVVFCRSNDIIWGCYGANAVHFSMLLEYMALWIGCPVGTYTQVSVNWHAYTSMLDKVKDIRPDKANFVENRYDCNGESVVHTPMTGGIEDVDASIARLLYDADSGFHNFCEESDTDWAKTVFYVLHAHCMYKEDAIQTGLKSLARAPIQNNDWVVAAREWLQRRI